MKPFVKVVDILGHVFFMHSFDENDDKGIVFFNEEPSVSVIGIDGKKQEFEFSSKAIAKIFSLAFGERTEEFLEKWIESPINELCAFLDTKELYYELHNTGVDFINTFEEGLYGDGNYYFKLSQKKEGWIISIVFQKGEEIESKPVKILKFSYK